MHFRLKSIASVFLCFVFVSMHCRQELMKRIDECINLNDAYQNRFQRIKEKLKANPKEPQFEFSENYIFGR